MKERMMVTDADLQNYIYFQQKVEVYVDGEFDDVCLIADYSDTSVQVVGGGFYLRSNISTRIV